LSKHSEVKEKKKVGLVPKILLIIFIAIIIFVLVAGVSGYFWAKHKWDKMDYVDLSSSDIEVNPGVNESLKGYRNIVLLGLDAREDNFGTGNRSDCIMIISLNQETKNVKIASVYRDTYLNIDGHGLDKVTHAYSYGGPKLALSTLNKNLDLNITEFVAVNFDTVHTVVDSVGGVDINIEQSELKYINNYITAADKQFGTSTPKITTTGKQTLNGVQALAYSRIRYTEGGDYKRTERMRDVLIAVFEKAKTMSVSDLNSLSDTILPHVSTNININEAIGMLPQLTNINVNESIGWPYEVKGITLDRWYGVPVTLEENVSKLHKDLFNETDYNPSDTVKNISTSIINKTGYR
jgi:LCP family protein required for cell wall assembly